MGKSYEYGKDKNGNKNYQGKDYQAQGKQPDNTRKAPTQGGYTPPGGGSNFDKGNLNKNKTTNQPGQNQWGTGSISDKNKGGTDTSRR